MFAAIGQFVASLFLGLVVVLVIKFSADAVRAVTKDTHPVLMFIVYITYVGAMLSFLGYMVLQTFILN